MGYSTIKFDNNVIKNKTCKITYSGMLFQNNSEFVNIVYGFGNEWNHTKEQEMEKTEQGFVAEVNMLDYDTFNFCFRNSNYEWDNNNYQNYTSPIENEEETAEINFILNDESVITDIVDNLCNIDISDIQEPQSIQKIESLEAEEQVITSEGTPFEINVIENVPVNIEDSLVNTVEATGLENDIENLFTDIYQNATIENQEDPSVDNNEFNMNNLIDEILSPIISSSNIEENSILENISLVDEENNFVDNFEDLDEISYLDNKIDSLITDLFNNTKAFAADNTVEEQETNNEIDEKINNIIDETITGSAKVELAEETEQIEKIPDFTVIEDEEESLINSVIENASESNEKNTSLIETKNQDGFIVSPRSLSKFYIFKKRIKLAFSKLFVTIPKILSGEFYTEKD